MYDCVILGHIHVGLKDNDNHAIKVRSLAFKVRVFMETELVAANKNCYFVYVGQLLGSSFRYCYIMPYKLKNDYHLRICEIHAGNETPLFRGQSSCHTDS